MKSYIFAAAALVGAVAQGAVIRREDCDETTKAPGGPVVSTAETKPGNTLPCGATSSSEYTVKAGNTLFQISDETGVGVCDIAAASGIDNINLIYPDQILTIPIGCTTTDNTTCVTTPDTPATDTCVKGPPPTYTVVSGDTLGAIAKDFEITTAALISANSQISNPDVISIGQVINVPICPGSSCKSVDDYTIVSGDTFFDLASKSQTTVGQIKASNPGVKPETLAVGQVIKLPTGCA